MLGWLQLNIDVLDTYLFFLIAISVAAWNKENYSLLYVFPQFLKTYVETFEKSCDYLNNFKKQGSPTKILHIILGENYYLVCLRLRL